MTETAGTAPESAEHCWHGTGITLTTDPPQHPEVCCQCDARRTRTSRVVPLSGHGPFTSGAGAVREDTIYYGGDEPCVPPADEPGAGDDDDE